MKAENRSRIVHFGFLADDRARCGAADMERRLNPAHVTCVKCKRIFEAERETAERLPPFLLLDPLELTPERYDTLARLAKITGNAGAIVHEAVSQYLERAKAALL